MDEDQFKILTAKLDEIIKHLENLDRRSLSAKYDKKTKNVHIESVEHER